MAPHPHDAGRNRASQHRLKCPRLLPVHWGKFTLANHPWNDPPSRAIKNAAEKGVNITTPMIGEPVILGQTYPNKHWWNG